MLGLESIKEELRHKPYNELRKMAKALRPGRSPTKEHLVDLVAQAIASHKLQPLDWDLHSLPELSNTSSEDPIISEDHHMAPVEAQNAEVDAREQDQDTLPYNEGLRSANKVALERSCSPQTKEALCEKSVLARDLQRGGQHESTCQTTRAAASGHQQHDLSFMKHSFNIMVFSLFLAIIIGLALVDRKTWQSLRTTVLAKYYMFFTSGLTHGIVSTPSQQVGSSCSTIFRSVLLEDIVPGNMKKHTVLLREDSHFASGPRKAMALLLASPPSTPENPEDSMLQQAIQSMLEKIPSTCDSCVLQERGSDRFPPGPDARGALQKLLAEFHGRCPQGLVIFNDADKITANLLPVFINALSEQGHFEYNGQHVDTSSATYIFIVQMPEPYPDHQEFERFQSKVKGHLMSAWRTGEQASSASAVAMALRRRIDLVLPIHIAAPIAGSTDRTVVF